MNFSRLSTGGDSLTLHTSASADQGPEALVLSVFGSTVSESSRVSLLPATAGDILRRQRSWVGEAGKEVLTPVEDGTVVLDGQLRSCVRLQAGALVGFELPEENVAVLVKNCQGPVVLETVLDLRPYFSSWYSAATSGQSLEW